ncbi:MAG TPA: hypothetical protein DD384_06065 [Firmicutes bacterium]|nr:hypothetical protein [Bacillota bacterium]
MTLPIHIEFLVEDASFEKFLMKFMNIDSIQRKIREKDISYNVHSYRGLGSVINISSSKEISTFKQTTLLGNLKKLIKGYNRTFCPSQDQIDYRIMVVCDLDDKQEKDFRSTLDNLLKECDNSLHVCFSFAIEELEAWFLGDINAIQKAYPNVKLQILQSYVNDSICGTWETLAKALEIDVSKLKKNSYSLIGTLKCTWAENITPYMNIDNNQSKSFNIFMTKIKEL